MANLTFFWLEVVESRDRQCLERLSYRWRKPTTSVNIRFYPLEHTIGLITNANICYICSNFSCVLNRRINDFPVISEGECFDNPVVLRHLWTYFSRICWTTPSTCKRHSPTPLRSNTSFPIFRNISRIQWTVLDTSNAIQPLPNKRDRDLQHIATHVMVPAVPAVCREWIRQKHRRLSLVWNH